MTQNYSPMTRRDFLKLAGLAAPALGLAACGPSLVMPAATSAKTTAAAAIATATAAATATMDMGGGTGGATTPVPAAEDMDAMHGAGVQTFLGNIGKNPSFWGTPLEYRMEDGFKVFEVTCKQVQWETMPGTLIDAMTYNGIVPGPEIRVTQGDQVRIIVKNEMDQSTAVHFHGVQLPNNMDAVPFITQPPIKPGETFTYEFTAKNPGSHMYHSHHNAAEQVTKGLMGAFIIEPLDKSKEPQYDAEYTLTLNDTGIGFTLNGKGFPYTQPIIAKLGDRVWVRYMNEGLLIHPMHLHGLEQQVFAKDGWYLPQPYTCDTLSIAPGERYDTLITCHTAGAWAFHCHILTHAESAHGMFGMVTALVVQ
jgi:FtsP/CotA-like multicopper oxidase with cupredoxin domain